MDIKFGLVGAGFMLLAACGEESQKPDLDITGQWHVKHHFDERCEVNAAFTESLMILSFYSLEPGACQPELYGIVNNALPIRIDSKTDFFAEDGSLAATLAVSAPNHGASGTLALQATAQGLMGSILSANDPNDALQPLLQQNYSLTRASNENLDFLLGVWDTPCEELGISEQGEFCDFIEFTEAGSGRVRLIGGSLIDPNGHAPNSENQWDTFSYAIRHAERKADGAAFFDLIIVSSNSGLRPESGRLSVAENGMTMTLYDGEKSVGMLYRAQ